MFVFVLIVKHKSECQHTFKNQEKNTFFFVLTMFSIDYISAVQNQLYGSIEELSLYLTAYATKWRNSNFWSISYPTFFWLCSFPETGCFSGITKNILKWRFLIRFWLRYWNMNRFFQIEKVQLRNDQITRKITFFDQNRSYAVFWLFLSHFWMKSTCFCYQNDQRKKLYKPCQFHRI